MYISLDKELKIIGMNVIKVIELIGESYYMDQEILEYKTIPGYICIHINDDSVTKIEYIIPND